MSEKKKVWRKEVEQRERERERETSWNVQAELGADAPLETGIERVARLAVAAQVHSCVSNLKKKSPMTGFRLPRARRFEHQHIFRWRLKVTTKRKRTSFQVLLRITVSTLFFKGERRQQTRPIHRRRTLLLMEMLQNKKKKRNEKRRFTFRTGAEDAGGRVVADVAAVVAAVAAEVVGAAQAFVGAVAAVDDAVADPVRLRGQKKRST